MPTFYAQSGLKGAIFALGAFALYSLHDVIIKHLGATYSVFQVVFFLNLFSLPMILVMLIADPAKANLLPRHPFWILARSLASVVVGVAVFYAFTVLDFAETYSILFAAPLFITALSVPILKEHVGMRRWAAVLVGFVGVLIVLQPGISDIGIGHASALFGSSGVAFMFISVRKIGRDERTAVLVIYPLLANLAFMSVVLGFVYQPMSLADLALCAVMAGLAFIAMLFVISAYRIAPAATVAPMQYSQMLWAIFYGALLFGEALETRVIIGAVVIIASGTYITWRESRLQNDVQVV